jgi:hypothetical protein
MTLWSKKIGAVSNELAALWIRIRIKFKGKIRVRIRIKVISWILIRINLQMTSQNGYFFKVFELLLGSEDPDPIKVTGRIRIHIKVIRIPNTV